ncbi:hypothetical protein Plhal304r1_c027g0091401 [Plasmopara halstedii]
MRRHSRLARQVAVCVLTSPSMKSRKDTSRLKVDRSGPRYGVVSNQPSSLLKIQVCCLAQLMQLYQPLRPHSELPRVLSQQEQLNERKEQSERYHMRNATRPEHEDLIKSIRGEVRRRYSVGVAKPKAMIYPHMRDHGLDQFKCFLIKEYDVIDRVHLEAYETLWIKKLKACNKNLPFAIKK